MIEVPKLVNLLRNELRERGVSQAELARRLGRAREQVCQLVNDPEPNPSLRTALAIAAALDAPVEKLYRLAGDVHHGA